jgi:hypothetical protein
MKHRDFESTKKRVMEKKGMQEKDPIMNGAEEILCQISVLRKRLPTYSFIRQWLDRVLRHS